jgi:hypothetical protein
MCTARWRRVAITSRRLLTASVLCLIHSQASVSHCVSFSTLVWIRYLLSRKQKGCPSPMSMSVHSFTTSTSAALCPHNTFAQSVDDAHAVWDRVDQNDAMDSVLPCLQHYQWSLQDACRHLASNVCGRVVAPSQHPEDSGERGCTSATSVSSRLTRPHIVHRTLLCFVSCYCRPPETLQAIRRRHATTAQVVVILAVPWDEQQSLWELWDLHASNDFHDNIAHSPTGHIPTIVIVPVPFIVADPPTPLAQKTHATMWVDGMNSYLMGTLALICNARVMKCFVGIQTSKQMPRSGVEGACSEQRVASLDVAVFHHCREHLRSIQHGLQLGSASASEARLRYDDVTTFSFIFVESQFAS